MPTARPIDRALSRNEAAVVAGVTPKALSQMLTRGQGPVVRKRGNRTLYLESEVLQWLRGLPLAVNGPQPAAQS